MADTEDCYSGMGLRAGPDTWVGCMSLLRVVPWSWGEDSLVAKSGTTSSFLSFFFFPTRYERLEEQLNDLTELHQNEMTNLKQELASMEEKVAYQSYERARDIQV